MQLKPEACPSCEGINMHFCTGLRFWRCLQLRGPCHALSKLQLEDLLLLTVHTDILMYPFEGRTEKELASFLYPLQ
jgi:hypothetical protein